MVNTVNNVYIDYGFWKGSEELNTQNKILSNQEDNGFSLVEDSMEDSMIEEFNDDFVIVDKKELEEIENKYIRNQEAKEKIREKITQVGIAAAYYTFRNEYGVTAAKHIISCYLYTQTEITSKWIPEKIKQYALAHLIANTTGKILTQRIAGVALGTVFNYAGAILTGVAAVKFAASLRNFGKQEQDKVSIGITYPIKKIASSLAGWWGGK